MFVEYAGSTDGQRVHLLVFGSLALDYLLLLAVRRERTRAQHKPPITRSNSREQAGAQAAEGQSPLGVGFSAEQKSNE